jgi:hypothetical protein
MLVAGVSASVLALAGIVTTGAVGLATIAGSVYGSARDRKQTLALAQQQQEQACPPPRRAAIREAL